MNKPLRRPGGFEGESVNKLFEEEFQ